MSITPNSAMPGQTSRSLDRVLLALAVTAILGALGSGSWAVLDRQLARDYVAGDRLDSLPEAHFERGPKTLVLWLDTRCHFCSESMGVYRLMIASRHSARIVVVGREPVDALTQYLAANAIQDVEVVSVGGRKIRFSGTPTLALVGPDAVVRGVWRGKLQSAAQEKEVLSKID